MKTRAELAWNAARHIIASIVVVALAWAVSLTSPNLELTWFAAIFISGFWLGRERRDHEIRASIPVRNWWKGWWIPSWSIDELVDMVPAIVAALGAAAVLRMWM